MISSDFVNVDNFLMIGVAKSATTFPQPYNTIETRNSYKKSTKLGDLACGQDSSTTGKSYNLE